MFIDGVVELDLDNYNKELWFIDYAKILSIDDLPGEKWEDIIIDDIDFTGYYQESNFGRTKSLKREIISGYGAKHTTKNRILKPQKSAKGYYDAVLYKNGIHYSKQVHRLVASCFVENDDLNRKTVVNHKDENKSNNRADNLEWCTEEYNRNYGSAIKRRTDKIKIPIVQLSLDGESVEVFDKIIDVIKFGYDSSAVIACCKKKRITHKNYVWMYKKDYDKIGQDNIKEYLNQFLLNKRSKQVVQLSINNDFIKIWEEAKEASLAGFNPACIRLCCSHKMETHKKYKWMYKIEYDELISHTI